ncbi:MAG: hypothetical protein ACLTSX_04445 [Collinsella sp.]
MKLEDLVDGADDLLGVIRRENSLGGMCSLAVDRPGAFLALPRCRPQIAAGPRGCEPRARRGSLGRV